MSEINTNEEVELHSPTFIAKKFSNLLHKYQDGRERKVFLNFDDGTNKNFAYSRKHNVRKILLNIEKQYIDV